MIGDDLIDINAWSGFLQTLGWSKPQRKLVFTVLLTLAAKTKEKEAA